MRQRALILVPSLLALTPFAQAESYSLFSGSNPLPGKQYINGSLNSSVFRQSNYRPDIDRPSTDYWRTRAELGAKVEFDERSEVRLSLAYDNRAGTVEDVNELDSEDNGVVVMDEAVLVLKDIFGHSVGTDLAIGRQPVVHDLTPNTAILFDSRANDAVVTGWDGLTAFAEVSSFLISPYYYMIDPAYTGRGFENDPLNAPSDDKPNLLYGFLFDWRPSVANAENEVFFTASYNFQERLPLAAAADGYANKLQTWYLGTDWDLSNGWQFLLEYAGQEGEMDTNVGFGGSAYTIALKYHFTSNGRRVSHLDFKYDNFSGDDGSPFKYKGFVNPYEGLSEMLIAEDEVYGELNSIIPGDGNYNATKVMYEHSFLDDQSVRLFLGAAQYSLNELPTGVTSKELGREFDIILNIDYNYYISLSIFGAVFTADTALRELRGGSDKDIRLMGLSANVSF